MTHDPQFRKSLAGVATRQQMYELFNQPANGPHEDHASGNAFDGQWFEIGQSDHDRMFEVLPPLFIRSGMFASSERKAGSVGSVFFDILIDGRKRWFHGYCDLSDRNSPDALRTAIIAHETGATDP